MAHMREIFQRNRGLADMAANGEITAAKFEAVFGKQAEDVEALLESIAAQYGKTKSEMMEWAVRVKTTITGSFDVTNGDAVNLIKLAIDLEDHNERQ